MNSLCSPAEPGWRRNESHAGSGSLVRGDSRPDRSRWPRGRARVCAGAAVGAVGLVTSLLVAGPAGAVSLTQVGGSPVISAEAPGNSLLAFEQPIGTTAWTQQTVAGTGTTYSLTTAAE